MSATTVTAVVLAAVFLPLGVAKLVAVPAMRRAADHVGMTTTHYRLLGGLEVAAAAALPAGLRIPALGAAAATGLILLAVAYFTGEYDRYPGLDAAGHHAVDRGNALALFPRLS